MKLPWVYVTRKGHKSFHVPKLRAMKMCGERGGNAPHIFDLAARWR
jgi:hypothetical protein